MRKTYYAPPSVGNFTVGFDVLGLSLAARNGELLGDRLTIEQVAENSSLPALEVNGRYRHQLPETVRVNLVLRCWEAFRQAVDRPLPALHFVLEKALPVGSGLGSSASSVVVTCFGLNDFFEQPLSDLQLLNLMAELEGGVSGAVHLDNIAPAYFGGLQLMTSNMAQPTRRLPWFEHWSVVVSYPGTVINTSAARQVLPQQIPLTDTIAVSRNIASFIAGLYAQDETLALSALQDCIAEPYRQVLIPQLLPLRQRAQQLGVAHLGISGAGPTLFALCTDDAQAEAMQQLFIRHYHSNDDAFTCHCVIDDVGARQLMKQEGYDATY